MHIVIHINFRREYFNYEPLPLSQWDFLSASPGWCRASSEAGLVSADPKPWRPLHRGVLCWVLLKLSVFCQRHLPPNVLASVRVLDGRFFVYATRSKL